MASGRSSLENPGAVSTSNGTETAPPRPYGKRRSWQGGKKDPPKSREDYVKTSLEFNFTDRDFQSISMF